MTFSCSVWHTQKSIVVADAFPASRRTSGQWAFNLDGAQLNLQAGEMSGGGACKRDLQTSAAIFYTLIHK